MRTDAVLTALAAAVEAAPMDAELRVLYGDRLLDAGRAAEALGQAMLALQFRSEHSTAASLLERATASLAEGAADRRPGGDAGAVPPAVAEPDWSRLEQEAGWGDPMAAPFIDSGEALPAAAAQRERVTLDDVGGLDHVKARIRQSFLEPARNPEIARAFGQSGRGGLLLYGPPGCGKTYMARAIAGELGAGFLSVTLADVLGMWFGESEQRLHDLFVRGRAMAPAVLFLDEVDALGGKRSGYTGGSGMRTVVNQLLMELDGTAGENEGLFVLAATNHPWDVDTALLRPGRFDRSVLVLPPDEPAREAILRRALGARPVEGIDLTRIVRRTDGFSGADLQHLCDAASQHAMMDSIDAGAVRPVQMGDLDRALREVRSSIGPWLESARNVASFGNADGRYDELVAYLRSRKLL